MNTNYMRPSELYEWELNNLHTFPDDEQDKILPNLQHLKWVQDMLEKLSPYHREAFKFKLLNQLQNEAIPFCPLSITYIIYNL